MLSSAFPEYQAHTWYIDRHEGKTLMYKKPNQIKRKQKSQQMSNPETPMKLTRALRREKLPYVGAGRKGCLGVAFLPMRRGPQRTREKNHTAQISCSVSQV